MLKLSFSIVILSILLTPSVARPAADTVSAMTLDACMAYAVEHNPNVRQQIYANRNYR